MSETARHKERHFKRLDRKFKHCKDKMDKCNKDAVTDLPLDVQQMVEGVNIFKEDLEPQKSADPMICDKTI